MTKRKPKELLQKAGRPPSINNNTLYKLEEAFSWGCTDTEACLHAGISNACLYNYQIKNPSFVDRKNQLKENPVLLARATVVREMQKSGDLSLRFLERKKKDEFSVRTEVEQTSNVIIDVEGMETKDLIEELKKTIGKK